MKAVDSCTVFPHMRAIMPVFICISVVQWFYSSWLYRCFFVGGVDNFDSLSTAGSCTMQVRRKKGWFQ